MADKVISIERLGDERARGVVRFFVNDRGRKIFCRAALWALEIGERVSAAIADAAVCFELETNQRAAYAFVRRIPDGAEEGAEAHGVMLICADWVPDGFVAVSGFGLTYQGDEDGETN